MKKQLILLSLAVLVLFCSFAQAADRVVVIPLNTTSPVYVAGTEITSLPARITSSGFYFITKDLTFTGTNDNSIGIQANDVTLDLMGFSLIGPGGTVGGSGIDLWQKSNVEIRNGTIRNFPQKAIVEDSLLFTGAKGNRVINIRAINNNDGGIFFYNPGNIIDRCTVVGNGGHGILARYGSTISGNISYSNSGDGINADSGTTVIGNTSYKNGGYGINLSLSFADQNTAFGNTTGSLNCSSCNLGSNYFP